MHWAGDESRVHYFLLWTAGLGAWAAVFWALRRRMGPVTFVERQIAHVWAASMVCIAMLFPVEYLLDLPALKLSPILALVSGMVFLVKAGILSGSFYLQAVALVRHGDRHGPLGRLFARPVRYRFGRLFLFSGLEVLSAARGRQVTELGDFQ